MIRRNLMIKNKIVISFLMLLCLFVVIGSVAAADSNSSSTEIISQSDVQKDINIDHNDVVNQAVKEKDDGSFTALEKKINNANSNPIILENDYRMETNEKSHFLFKSIPITKNTYINGNGHSIDASGLGSIFLIKHHVNLTLENVILKNGDIGSIGGTLRANGGAIYVAEAAVINLKNCTLLNNHALYNGGAISLERTSKANIDNCSFIGNSADRYGGAIFSFRGENDANITNCHFKENSAEVGGAIYRFTVQNSTFEKNTAELGGAMYACNAYHCYFKENNGNCGGAMYGGNAYYCYFKENNGNSGRAMYMGNAYYCYFNEDNGNSERAIYRVNEYYCYFKEDNGNCEESIFEATAINSTFSNVSDKNSLIHAGNYQYSYVENCIFNYLESNNIENNNTTQSPKENNLTQHEQIADNKINSTISRRNLN